MAGRAFISVRGERAVGRCRRCCYYPPPPVRGAYHCGRCSTAPESRRPWPIDSNPSMRRHACRAEPCRPRLLTTDRRILCGVAPTQTRSAFGGCQSRLFLQVRMDITSTPNVGQVLIDRGECSYTLSDDEAARVSVVSQS